MAQLTRAARGETNPGETNGKGGLGGRGSARRQALAYQGAFESVFAILIGAGFGYGADRYFESVPWGLIVGLLLGFSAFVLRLVRLASELGVPHDGDDRSGGEG